MRHHNDHFRPLRQRRTKPDSPPAENARGRDTLQKMTPDDYRAASMLFEQFRELGESERAAALDSACAGNAAMRQNVLRLLDANRGASDGAFLERRAIDDASRFLTPDLPHFPRPAQF